MVAGRGRWGLLVRAIGWRAGSSLAFFLVGVVAVAAATAGPIYLASADQSVLNSVLASASAGEVGITLQARPGTATTLGTLQRLASGPAAAGIRADVGRPIVTVEDEATTLDRATQRSYLLEVVARTGVCGRLQLVRGRCATAAGQVVLSDRSAAELGLRVGEVVHVAGRRGPGRALVVVGLYAPVGAAAPYWWGDDLFAFGTRVGTTGLALDAAFVTERTALSIGSAAARSPLLQLPLRPGRPAASSVPAFEGALAKLTSAGATAGVSVGTQLPALFARASADEQVMSTIVAIIVLQLLLLALIVLYGAATLASEARAPDLAVAELRGLPRRAMVRLALREPAVLLVAATPVGLLVAWAAVALLARPLFGAGVPVRIDSLALVAALVALAGGTAAAALGSRSLLTGAPERRGAPIGGRRVTAVEAAVVALAFAAIADLAVSGVGSGSGTHPLAAFAPGLIALAVGVLGARLLPLVCRGATRLTRASRRVGAALAVRNVLRRPSLSRQVVVLTIALSLVTFSAVGWAVAGRNRALEAGFSVGATRVLDVRARPGVDLVAAVRAADPSGRQAMAAVVVQSNDGMTLALDTTRLAAVASWPAGTSSASAAAVARYLKGTPGPPTFLLGTALGVTVAAERVPRPAPVLAATVFDERYDAEETVTFGALRPGRHRYTATLLGSCAVACRLDTLQLSWNGSGTRTVGLAFGGLETRGPSGVWRTVSPGFSPPARWGGPAGSDEVTVTAPAAAGPDAVLHTSWRLNPSEATPSIGPRDVPAPLPAVVTSEVAAANEVLNPASTVPLVGLDEAVLTGRAGLVVPALPEVGADATLVDLSLLRLLQAGPLAGATEQVWLAPGAGPGLTARLERAGLTITSTSTVAALEHRLDHTASAYAFDLFVLAAVASAAIAAGALLFGLAAASRRRAVEMMALEATGVPRRALRRGLALEQLLVVASGTVLGVGAGIASAAFALRSLPETTAGRIGPPLSYALPPGFIAGAGAATLALLVVCAAVGVAVTVRSATVDKLRLGDE